MTNASNLVLQDVYVCTRDWEICMLLLGPVALEGPRQERVLSPSRSPELRLRQAYSISPRGPQWHLPFAPDYCLLVVFQA